MVSALKLLRMTPPKPRSVERRPHLCVHLAEFCVQLLLLRLRCQVFLQSGLHVVNGPTLGPTPLIQQHAVFLLQRPRLRSPLARVDCLPAQSERHLVHHQHHNVHHCARQAAKYRRALRRRTTGNLAGSTRPSRRIVQDLPPGFLRRGTRGIHRFR